MSGNVRKTFTNEDGAIDLASIMVGIIVIGLIGGIIASTVFVVIPWAQDKAAVGSIDSVTTAQGVDKVKNGRYDSAIDLTAASLLPPLNPLEIDSKVTSSAGWVTAAKSGSGRVFLATDKSPKPIDVTGTTYTGTLKPPTPKPVYVSNTGGSLPAGTYYYKLTSISNGESVASEEFSVTTTGNTSYIALSWTNAPGSINVAIYRSTSPGTETRLIQTSGDFYTNSSFGTPGTQIPPTVSGGTYSAQITDVASALSAQ